MNESLSLLLPGYDDGYNDDNRPSRQPCRQTLRSLLTDFQTNPLPLPVWIWNCFVIYIVISVAWLLIKIESIIWSRSPSFSWEFSDNGKAKLDFKNELSPPGSLGGRMVMVESVVPD